MPHVDDHANASARFTLTEIAPLATVLKPEDQVRKAVRPGARC